LVYDLWLFAFAVWFRIIVERKHQVFISASVEFGVELLKALSRRCQIYLLAKLLGVFRLVYYR